MNIKPGTEFQFGFFPQVLPGKNMPEVHPVDWIALKADTESGKVLAISKYILACRRFDTKNNQWALSEIRSWLNNVFLPAAVQLNSERNAVSDTPLSDCGTKDKLFLLSRDEIEEFLTNRYEKMCLSVCSDGMKAFGWWCRSSQAPGSRVDGINDEGLLTMYNVKSKSHGIRPAMWIDVNKAFLFT